MSRTFLEHQSTCFQSWHESLGRASRQIRKLERGMLWTGQGSKDEPMGETARVALVGITQPRRTGAGLAGHSEQGLPVCTNPG